MVLPLTLFKPVQALLIKDQVTLYRLSPDLVKFLVERLSPEAFHTLALGNRRWFQLLYNIAREVIEKRWPHLFHKHKGPGQDWIQIYCTKMQVQRNLVAGHCELMTLSRNLPRECHSYAFGLCHGKVLVKHYPPQSDVWPPPPLIFTEQIDVVSLKDGIIHKTLASRGHMTGAGCIWKEIDTHFQGWNMQTGELEYDFLLTAPPGFRSSAPLCVLKNRPSAMPTALREGAPLSCSPLLDRCHKAYLY